MHWCLREGAWRRWGRGSGLQREGEREGERERKEKNESAPSLLAHSPLTTDKKRERRISWLFSPTYSPCPAPFSPLVPASSRGASLPPHTSRKGSSSSSSCSKKKVKHALPRARSAVSSGAPRDLEDDSGIGRAQPLRRRRRRCGIPPRAQARVRHAGVVPSVWVQGTRRREGRENEKEAMDVSTDD